jgi:non-ribosomal peptide synthetase component F
VVAVLAIWKAGAGYVALDAEDTDARHRQIIVRASLGVVVTQGRLDPSELEGLSTVVVDDDGPSRAPLVTDPEAGVDADVALVFYGSGPSAVPHGVVIEHGGVVNLLAGLRGHVLRPSSEPTPLVGLRVCLSARPTDDAFLRQLVPVLDGHTLQVVPGDAGGGVAALVALIGSGDVDLVDCPPGELEDLVGAGLSAALAARPTGAATPVVVAGSRAPIRCDTLSVLGSMNMARTYLLYGPPECSFGAAVSPVSTGAGRISLGPPLGAGMGVVLDAQGRLVPEGVTGELHLAGPGLSTGYLGEADATARRFVTLKLAGPGGASTRLFKTGQRARYLPGARIELVGRVADMVDLRGFHVDRARMAAALRQCRGVAGVEVVLDQDGAGEPHLVALVVPEKGSPAPTLVELRTELWSRLPGYAWPASVIVVPRLSARGGQPWPAGAPSQPAYPESPEARLLASLWAEVRGVEHVGVSENYWQSFSFLDAMALAGEQGVPIGSQEVTRNRVLATLATALAAAGGA